MQQNCLSTGTTWEEEGGSVEKGCSGGGRGEEEVRYATNSFFTEVRLARLARRASDKEGNVFLILLRLGCHAYVL